MSAPAPSPPPRAGNGLQADEAATRVFNPKAADYQAARPAYPAPLFDHLGARVAAPGPGQCWVDVGAGTGLFTRGLLGQGHPVLAVEPSEPMRAAADAALAGWPGYRSAPGRAEALPLPDGAATLITAAQAFHWFEVPRARAECQRVLAPGGQVALVWNDRCADDPLQQALDALFSRWGGERRARQLAQEARRAEGVAAFFGRPGADVERWPHQQVLDTAGLLSLAFSRSYMPARDSAEGQAAADALRALVPRFASPGDGRLVMRYQTVLFLGPLG